MPIQLKSHAADAQGHPAKFGFLVTPEDQQGIRNDTQLYADVEKEGRAIVCEYLSWTWTPAAVVELRPLEFEQTWKGD